MEERHACVCVCEKTHVCELAAENVCPHVHVCGVTVGGCAGRLGWGVCVCARVHSLTIQIFFPMQISSHLVKC